MPTARGPGSTAAPGPRRGKSARAQRLSWGSELLDLRLCRHPIRRRGLCQHRGGWVRRGLAAGQFEFLLTRVLQHRTKPGPAAADSRRPQSPREALGRRFLPASARVTSGFPSGRFAPRLAANESHLRRPLADAELNPHLEPAPPQFPLQALSHGARGAAPPWGRRQ